VELAASVREHYCVFTVLGGSPYNIISNIYIYIYIYINIFCLPLYGCETWSLKLGEELRQRVYENRVLRRVFGAKRDEVTGEWRKLHNEELNDLYCSPNIVRVVKYLGLRGKGDRGVEKTT